MILRHANITVDGRCIDLLLTEDEISVGLERFLKEENREFIEIDKCCTCWPINKPPECPFWQRVLGICKQCDQQED